MPSLIQSPCIHYVPKVRVIYKSKKNTLLIAPLSTCILQMFQVFYYDSKMTEIENPYMTPKPTRLGQRLENNPLVSIRDG